MPDLIAQGPERAQRWRRHLPEDGASRWLGRQQADWLVPWDVCVSRRHARLTWRSSELEVVVEPAATNEVFVEGQPRREFRLRTGQHFVIGDTSFTLVDHRAELSLDVPPPRDQQTFTAEMLRRRPFRHAQTQIQAMLRLPEILTSGPRDDGLWVQLVNLLLTSIPQVEAVAVIRSSAPANSPAQNPSTMSRDPETGASPGGGAHGGGPPSAAWEIVHWDRAAESADAFRPSIRLLEEAHRTGQSVVHRWRAERDEPSTAEAHGFGWAFCTPVPGQACRGQLLYLGGGPAGSTLTTQDDLLDSLKLTEFVASVTGSLCDHRDLQRRDAAIAPFFSAPVRDALVRMNPEEVLAPREAEVTVLFCDLRGFSRQSEQSAGDLLGLLDRVSRSLGIATRAILDSGGVIGDFHGDAVMGFWGWPLPQEDRWREACRAALAIERAFGELAATPGHPLTGFRAGVGLASGPAVAGRIGTIDQVKITAFGPVVNLAARLEGMTRHLRASILLDEATARGLGEADRPAPGLLRLLATIRPHGMDAPQRIYDLRLDDDGKLAASNPLFEEARGHFERGDWPQATGLFEQLPGGDPCRDFYLALLRRHASRAPEAWDGVIELDGK